MRYIGNKENIISQIDSILETRNIKGERFFDFFAGTASVAKYYKQKGYTIQSSDVMYMSYCLQKAYIENNEEEPFFKQIVPLISNNKKSITLFDTPLDIVINYLNQIPDNNGFIYENYTPTGTRNLEVPRMYFSDENGLRIDAIRQQIERWKNEGLLLENEYYILLSCLIETVSLYANVAGVYAAFYKKWDPRAVKRLELRRIKLLNNQKKNIVHNSNSLDLIKTIDTDILYLDPPYNERQYLPNYHVLETIAKYDNPIIKGVTGMRNYENQKSSFCNPKTAIIDIESIIQKSKFKHLVLSYNSEGIMSKEDIIAIMSKYGKVTFDQFQYARFKSNNNGLAKTKKTVYEQVYILTK